MHYIDIVVWVVLALALFNGLKQGGIVQGCSIVAILLGIWLASRYSGVVGGWLHLSKSWASVGGFLIIFILVIIAVSCLSRLLKGLFDFAGLGLVDRVLGAVLSVVKFAIILSLLLGAFDAINNQFNIVPKESLGKSMLYTPIKGFSSKVFSTINKTQKQLESGIEKN